LQARTTPLPPGTPPPLPAGAVELRTRLGSFWFDGADNKVVPWIRREATWEADVLRLFSAVVQRGMVAIDIGANVGYHTVALARLVGELGHVHAFEPLPETVDLLRANVWRHSYSNITVHPQAVSDRSGTVHIELNTDGASSSRLAATGLEAQAVTLDEALPGISVDVLKLDIEGAEPLALRGATELLRRSPRLLAVVEFRNAPHLDGSAPEDALDLYENLGFELCVLHPEGRPVPATAQAILDAASKVETLNIVLRRPARTG